MQVPAAVVAAEVIKDGGSLEQAFVAAALVSGVESNGDPTELSGGVGPAAGLFQFEPGTWAGDGGLAYGKVAQDASWQDQVKVYLNATAGNNFHSWGPDVVSAANRGNPNDPKNPAYHYTGPVQATSVVASTVSSLEASGALKSFPYDVPTSWADAGGALGSNPVPGPVGDVLGLATGGTVAGDVANAWHAATGWATDLDQILSDLLSPAWWLRVGTGALGLALFGIGLVGFISTTKPGQKATSDIGAATKDAAMAAVVA